MGRPALWVGKSLDDLINLEINVLCEKYPNEDKNKLRALKRYHRKKAGMEQEGRLYKTWEVSAFNKETQEWETAVNHGYEYTPDPDALAEVYEPAIQAKITPTRKKRTETLGRTLLVFGDSQIGYHRVYDREGNDSLIPTHSEEALSILTQINADLRPHEIINVSDTVDFAEFGRFDPSSDSFHRTLGPALQRAHNLYAQLRADNPDAKITETDSNHTTRVHKAVMKKMPELYGMTLPGENYPLMSYYRLANLAPLGVNFIAGYGGAEYVYGENNPIIFKHGTHSSSSPGATVRKEALQNPTVNVVRGHGHSAEHIAQTGRDGINRHYIQLGTTCETTGVVPSYHSAMDDFGHPIHNQENWQQQLLLIEDFDGRYNFNVIDIINGIANYGNRRYEA